MMILTGDCLEILPTLDAESVQCCVTSPPYYGLRDYGCAGQIGLEATPEAYVEKLVAVFREVRRVLRDDGTVWLNLGDSYCGGGGFCPGAPSNQHTRSGQRGESVYGVGMGIKPQGSLKPKDLIGIPWRVAFALQADGWYLRQDIIWAKPNPMPESVTDRCTKAHEYIFLLTKSARYFYDAEAVKEEAAWERWGDQSVVKEQQGTAKWIGNKSKAELQEMGKKNRRSVWTITTKPFKEAHFATFPPEIPEICIRAGTSEKGCCPECGSPWERVTKKGDVVEHPDRMNRTDDAKQFHKDDNQYGDGGSLGRMRVNSTTGWRPTCTCHRGDFSFPPVPCTVLDPFSGAGTTGNVAKRLGRKYTGIELSPEYAEMSKKRIDAVKLPLFE